MAIKTFIFCDRCNPGCVRMIDRRMSKEERSGRRSTDDRSWHEASKVEEAPKWLLLENGEHICPRCVEHLH